MADNYIYHPLGEFAKNYENGTIKPGDPRYPKSHAKHSNGGIDFNPGPNLPVYAMVSGTVLFIGTYKSDADYEDNCAGYYVEISTNDFGYSGTVYMRYLEMGRLSETLAQAVGIKGGVAGDRIQEVAHFKENVSIHINKGDIVGYTNEIGGGQSQLHIDLQQHRTLGSKATGSPQMDFPFTKENSPIGEYGTGYSDSDGNWYQNGELIGILGSDGIGKTPGADFNVFNHYWYCTILSKPTYLENSATGGIIPSPTADVWSTDYLTLTFNSDFMGPCPSTPSEINNPEFIGIRTVSLACKQEFGLYEEGISYGKLIRTWILHYPPYHSQYGNFRDPSANLYTFAKWWSDVARYEWGAISHSYYEIEAPETEEMLNFIQNIYKNIMYPNIYGITKPKLIEACSNMPYSNQTTKIGSKEPVTYGSPLQFLVQEKYVLGWYVLFRTIRMDEEMKPTNPAVK